MYRQFGSIQVPSNRPHHAWKSIAVQQTHYTLTPPTFPSEERHLRFVCISDTHNQHNTLTLPSGDVLIHAGDFSGTGTHQQVQRFLEWFIQQPHPHKILIAGNHDLTLDAQHYERSWIRFHRKKKLNDEAIRDLLIQAQPYMHYLKDSMVTIEGTHIYGSPWQPAFFDWAFNLQRGEQCAQAWQQIPTHTDILITHGPPLGHGDLLVPKNTHCGCVDLLAEIQHRVKPKYHIFGHIHEGYGVSSDGTTTFVNASTCNLDYQPVQAPIVFDLPKINL